MSNYEDCPDYNSPIRLKQKVNLKKHCYDNPQGGTEFGGVLKGVVTTKMWWDYETGWRYVGKAKDLTKVYFSEFDIAGLGRMRAI